jgi:hypothetical protein
LKLRVEICQELSEKPVPTLPANRRPSDPW